MIEKKLSGRSMTEELWQEVSRRYEELKLEKENSIARYESAKNRLETIRSNYENWLSLKKELREYSRKKEYLETLKTLLKGNSFIEYISEERLRYIAKEASETLSILTRHRYDWNWIPRKVLSSVTTPMAVCADWSRPFQGEKHF